MESELAWRQRICPYCNVRHIGRCQKDVDRWLILEIVGDWCPYQGGEGFDESWNISEILIKVCCCLNFFTKTCLTNHCFSRDPHFVIQARVQRWNIFEILMKVCIPLEFFHKNMSHEQLPFMWSTFRHSSMGTKLKCFWETNETVLSAWFFSQKHFSRTISFHLIHISRF